MANNKIEALIRISSIGEKDNKFWVKDQDGEFYSGFREWEGTLNTEYNQLLSGNHNEPFKEGDNAFIVYTKSVGKDDKIYKNLKGIYPADGADVPTKGQTPRNDAPVASQSKDDKFWDMKAYKQCLWNYWLENAPHQDYKGDWKDYVWQAFQEIEADSKKRFFEFSKEAKEDLPIIDINDEVDVEGIPF